jgi:hypothetical protein
MIVWDRSPGRVTLAATAVATAGAAAAAACWYWRGNPFVWTVAAFAVGRLTAEIIVGVVRWWKKGPPESAA